MKDVLYRDNTLTLATGFNKEGTSAVTINYDISQKKFYFEGIDGVTKTLGNGNFSKLPIIPTNPNLEKALFSQIIDTLPDGEWERFPIYRFGTENKVYIKFNSTFASALNYGVVGKEITSVAFPISFWTKYTRAEEDFKLEIDLYKFGPEDTLSGNWSEIGGIEMRDILNEATPYFGGGFENYITARPNANNWVTLDGLELWKFNITPFVFTENDTLVLRVKVKEVNTFNGFDSLVYTEDLGEPYFNRREQQASESESSFSVPIFFNL